MRDVVEPSVRKETFAGSEVEVFSHPAYAQVSISHVQGRAFLYGSDFEHQNYVTLKIKGSEFRRDLSRDWHFEREYIAEIAMSEAQFATMISAPNRTGVPCTLLMKGGEAIPGVPHRDSKKLYDKEIERKLRKTVEALEKQRDEIKAGVGKLPKKVQEQILEPIETAIREIASNAPFIMKSFDEHMEASVEKAKVEVNAYATNTIMRAGLASLAGEAPILAIIDGNSA
jgi:uncharacterized protein YicC (UPF0701 family)